MGRRGRGGGGFGGGRRGGGRIGGSRGGGRRIGGGSRPGRSGRGGGGFGGGPRRPRRPRRRRRPFFGGWGRRRGFYGRPGYRGGGGCLGCFGGIGCIIPILVLAVVMFVFNFAWSIIPGGDGSTVFETAQVNPSTRDREPIEEGLAEETDYYTDELEWIQDETTLVNGLQHFYNETNIQPHVYITDSIDEEYDPSLDELDEYADELYDELFDDEAHLLLLFFENDVYEHEMSFHTTYGTQTATVMDQEAEDILFDYLQYHYTRDISDEEFFALSFQDTADRIMETTRSPWIPAIIVIGIVALAGILFAWWRNVINRDKNEEQEEPQEDQDSESTDDIDF